MTQTQRKVTGIVENPLNKPVQVRWRARLSEEGKGIRSGTVQIQLGEMPAKVVVHVKDEQGKLECDTDTVTGVKKHGPEREIRVLEKESMPGFAKKFLEAVVTRLQQEWTKLSRALSPQGQYLVGNGQLVILPGEYGQGATETYERPWIRFVSTPMGGMNRR